MSNPAPKPRRTPSEPPPPTTQPPKSQITLDGLNWKTDGKCFSFFRKSSHGNGDQKTFTQATINLSLHIKPDWLKRMKYELRRKNRIIFI